ncbi:uncharacterized protein LOC100865719 [Apis florea]|uniref:uncharacterized protein LOC100865719 n=1 Tax=Apis florea TaxID=7463 RepID=UPI00062925B0|nr:uncharacterized protein LOC100865719 [Apis florea]XP_012348308.1 uncharacterized protein LOC100865719 [Apis florea]XP_031775433.1 uncharacterized protein LOC100865719 [Apis florea]
MEMISMEYVIYVLRGTTYRGASSYAILITRCTNTSESISHKAGASVTPASAARGPGSGGAAPRLFPRITTFLEDGLLLLHGRAIVQGGASGKDYFLRLRPLKFPPGYFNIKLLVA